MDKRNTTVNGVKYRLLNEGFSLVRPNRMDKTNS
jgi:hypothetical protein